MSGVMGLGYVQVDATDLEAWAEFATMLGMQVASQSDDELTLRLDQRIWRWVIRRSDHDGVAGLGWEVANRTELEQLAGSLSEHGFEVTWGTAEECAARKVTGLLRYADPDGLAQELFHGQQKAATPFVSPTSATFLTGDFGMGHAMQFVSDSEAFRTLYMKALGFRLSDFLDVGPEPGTFLHTNPRHHSMAFATVPAVGSKFGHIMIEVDDMDAVGRAYDQVLAGEAVLGSTLGKHTNDQMTSFYVKTPSGFEIEYGVGGLLVDDDTWVPGRWEAPNIWGHRRLENTTEPRI